MNEVNKCMSDAHVALNEIVCSIGHADEPLGDDFDMAYYETCRYLIQSSLKEVDELVRKKIEKS